MGILILYHAEVNKSTSAENYKNSIQFSRIQRGIFSSYIFPKCPWKLFEFLQLPNLEVFF